MPNGLSQEKDTKLGSSKLVSPPYMIRITFTRFYEMFSAMLKFKLCNPICTKLEAKLLPQTSLKLIRLILHYRW